MNIGLLAFDLDGTLYLGEHAIPGAVATIRQLQDRFRVVFFTNNSTKTKDEITAKLNRLGFACSVNDVYTSSSTTAHILSTSGLDHLYVVGSESFCHEIRGHGLHIEGEDKAQHLVVGLDVGFNYRTIAQALAVLRRGGQFIACNNDASYPVENGQFLPGCGAMVGAIMGASGRNPDLIVGKPNTTILSMIGQTYGMQHHEMMVIGDSYASDIQMAKNYHCRSILFAPDTASTVESTTEMQVVRDHNELLNFLRILANEQRYR